jgi:hypothetical protein
MMNHEPCQPAGTPHAHPTPGWIELLSGIIYEFLNMHAIEKSIQGDNWKYAVHDR